MRLPAVLSTLAAFLAPLALALTTSAAPAKDAPKKADDDPTAAPSKATSKPSLSGKAAKRKLAKATKADKKGIAAKDEAGSSSKLPPLPGKSASKGLDADKDDKADKTAAKKPADASDEPPVELTGALPQAKLVDAKPKKKPEADAKSDAKSGAPSDEAKSASTKGDKKPDGKKAKKAKAAKDKDRDDKGFDPELGSTDKAEGKRPKIKTCLNPAVTFARLGQPTDVSFVLTTCKGRVAPGAVEYLSILGRPFDLPKPLSTTASVEGIMSQELATQAMKQFELAAKTTKKKQLDGELAPGIRRLDPGLVVRLQQIAEKFPGRTITLVSGYRPQSKGSPHSFGRAFDVRIDGVTNETLVGFCKTLADTGCGYYPNSYFVHVDVRPAGAGHVFWIDVSGPGEKPVYVKQWSPKLPPLPKSDKPVDPPESTTVQLDPLTGKPIEATVDAAKIGDMDDDPAGTSADPTMP